MSSREDFEAWCARDLFIGYGKETIHGLLQRNADGYYVGNDVRAMWLSWQAAQSSAVRKCMEIARLRSPNGRPCLFEQDAAKAFPEVFEGEAG